MKRRDITAFVTEVGQRALKEGPLEIDPMELYRFGGRLVMFAEKGPEALTPSARRSIALELCTVVIRSLLEKEPA